MMMYQDKSEKGIQKNGENRQRKTKFKWIYLFTAVISILMISSYIIFKNYQVTSDPDPGPNPLNPPKPPNPPKPLNKPKPPNPLNPPKPLKPLNPPIKPNQPDSDEDLEDEVFAEFKADEIDFSEIKKDLTSDFIGKLKEVPMRSKVPVGIVKRGDSNYASTVIQALFRIPTVRQVLANLEIYNEYHALRLSKLKEERILIKGSNDKAKKWNADKKIEMTMAAKDADAASGLNSMFSRLQSSEKNLVKFHSENLLKLEFFENFSNFKLVGKYFSKLIIDNLCEFIPESQHKHLLAQYKDTCSRSDHGDKSIYEEKFKKAIIAFNFTEKEKTLSDLMKNKFLLSRTELEWHGPPVKVTRQSKLVSLPKMVAIQISRISSEIDPSEVSEDERRICGYHGPLALEKRFDGSYKGTYKINDQSIEMPLKFDFAPYLTGGNKYSLKMFITCEEFEFEEKIGEEIDKTLVYSLIVKENDSKWYKIQDKKVEEVTVNSDNLNFGYIYFYEQESSSVNC